MINFQSIDLAMSFKFSTFKSKEKRYLAVLELNLELNFFSYRLTIFEKLIPPPISYLKGEISSISLYLNILSWSNNSRYSMDLCGEIKLYLLLIHSICFLT